MRIENRFEIDDLALCSVAVVTNLKTVCPRIDARVENSNGDSISIVFGILGEKRRRSRFTFRHQTFGRKLVFDYDVHRKFGATTSADKNLLDLLLVSIL